MLRSRLLGNKGKTEKNSYNQNTNIFKYFFLFIIFLVLLRETKNIIIINFHNCLRVGEPLTTYQRTNNNKKKISFVYLSYFVACFEDPGEGGPSHAVQAVIFLQVSAIDIKTCFFGIIHCILFYKCIQQKKHKMVQYMTFVYLLFL